MKLLTKAIEKKLIENYNKSQNGEENHKPVLKLFGGSACTWLITEYDQENELFFGLADLGLGFPEMGWISKAELEKIKFPPYMLGIERDAYFKAEKTLSEYAKEAREHRRIVA